MYVSSLIPVYAVRVRKGVRRGSLGVSAFVAVPKCVCVCVCV